MAIYGTAILAGCLLAGVLSGTALGMAMGIDADIGGVGLAMLFLVLVTERLRNSAMLGDDTRAGIHYWNSIYIPIVVAMAASQNVMGALSGGWVAIAAGTGGVVACFALVGTLSRFGRRERASTTGKAE